jgi:hypothetical protein
MPTNSQTRRKLDEAAFFLKKVLEFLVKGGPSAPPELEYFASAYISAARAVTWIMKSEFGSRPEWQVWWDQTIASLTEDESQVFRRIRDLRNDDLKTTPIRPEFGAFAVPVIGRSEPMKVIDDPVWGRIAVPLTKRTIWVLHEGGKELHATFSRFLTLLNRLVEECEQKFAE